MQRRTALSPTSIGHPSPLRQRLPAGAIALLAFLAACAGGPPGSQGSATAPARVIIFGEQHDQVDQQRQVADTVRELAARGRLHAVVLEMAERGASTTAVPADADEATVRRALAWDAAGWPWAQYGPVVMAAVRARVPVVGGNLPRAGMRESMRDAALDDSVPAGVRERMRGAVRDGHCGLLPQAMEPGMVRIQIARDRSMASTVANTLVQAPADRQVILLTGEQHALRDRGVPLHLAAAQPPVAVRVIGFGTGELGGVDERRPALHTESPDPCEGLAKRLQSAGPAGPAASTTTP